MGAQVTNKIARLSKQATVIGAQQQLTRMTMRRRRFLALAFSFSAIVAVIVAAVVTTGAQASTYFVATTGNDANAGTITSPWLTLSHGVAQLAPGDTLWIRGGTYTGSGNAMNSSITTVPGGTSANPIIIGAYNPGTLETVIVQTPDGSNTIALNSATQTYLTFQDLILDGSLESNTNFQGVYVSGGASHNTMLRLSVRNYPNFGVVFSNNNGNSPNNSIIGCSIHGNGSGLLATNGHGIYITGASGTVISGNTIYGNLGYGIHLNEDDGLYSNNGIVVSDNTVFSNGRSASVAEYGIVDDGGQNNLIYNNLVYSNWGGILVYSGTSNCRVYNNTIYNNNPSGGSGGIDMQYYASAPVIENNIVYLNAAAITDLGGGTGSPVVSNNLTTSPGLVNAANGNFQLLSGSPAIDAGITLSQVTSDFAGVSRPQGTAYDIGAFEYVAAPTALTAPTGFGVS
jgi:parallel beta-helix repeat protein